MTEDEWMACDEKKLTEMVNFISGAVHVVTTPIIRLATNRQLLLLAVRCLERVSHLVEDERTESVIRLAEQFADGMLPDLSFKTASLHAGDAAADIRNRLRDGPPISDFHRISGKLEVACAAAALHWPPSSAANIALHSAALGIKYWSKAGGRGGRPLANKERRAQLALLRDIFGNPLRPVAFDPAWRTPTAVGLARATYDDRAFDRLPILADALQDAGCEDADILAHCRGAGPHVRGCWVVDLVLGKE